MFFFSFQDNALPSNKSKNARHFIPQMANDYSYSTELSTIIVPEYTDDFSNVNYYTQIEPIFNAYCLACHNGEFQYNNNGLVMDSYIDLTAGGNSGPPIIPFDSENSILYKTITGTSYDDLGIPSMPYFSFLIPEFLRNTIKSSIVFTLLGKDTSSSLFPINSLIFAK